MAPPVATPGRPCRRIAITNASRLPSLALTKGVYPGGVGGAKLDLGLYHILKPWQFSIVVNTGDDFQHLGLTICPDMDTIMYTLAGNADEQKGWGLTNETWSCLNQLKDLGASSWFGLGDRDLAIHLHRTEQMRAGKSLSDITAELFSSFSVKANVYPMSNQPVGTIVHTQDAQLHHAIR